MAAKYLQTDSAGQTRVKASISTSSGTADANKIISTNAQGIIDSTLIDSDVIEIMVEASEAIAANRFVSLWDDSGTTKMRLADSTNARVAHGFVKEAVASGDMGRMFRSGRVTGLTGGTAGSEAFLGTSGQVGAPPDLTDDANLNGMNIVQELGIWLSDSVISFEHDAVIGS